MKEESKLLSIFTLSFIATFVGLQVLSFVNVSATGPDNCDQVITYEKSNDFSDSRVSINFESGDKQIDVSAQSGYQITEVALDVENDGHSGFFVYSTSAVNNFNPNPGDDIDEARVKVKKVCASPTPTPLPSTLPTPSPSSTPTPTPTPTPSPSVIPLSSPTPSPTPSPSPTPNPSPNQDDPSPSPSESPSPSSTPSPSPSTDPSATASASPSSNTGTGGNVTNDSSSSNLGSQSQSNVNQPTGQALGTSTLADTGSFVDTIMNSTLISGVLTLALGLKGHVKKTKKSNKR